MKKPESVQMRGTRPEPPVMNKFGVVFIVCNVDMQTHTHKHTHMYLRLWENHWASTIADAQ